MRRNGVAVDYPPPWAVFVAEEIARVKGWTGLMERE